MEIEFRLKQLLMQLGLDHHGIQQKIAEDSGLHRHTVRKMYYNQLNRPSLDTIAKVAKWLEDHDPAGKLAGEGLPQALIGRRPANTLRAIAAPGHVALYMGDFEAEEQPVGTGRWISLHDAEAAGLLVRELTTSTHMIGEHPQVRLVYVPFRFPAETQGPLEKPHSEHLNRARALYDQMMASRAHETAILIGSMRVNYLVELLAAELFKGCKPFETPKKPKVPFWLTYRARTRAISSCFGSTRTPPDLGHPTAPGIYYLEDEQANRWAYCDWTHKEHDAGVVLTARDPGNNALVLAVFGFSGYGTEALGQWLIDHGDDLWEHEVATSKLRVSVCICRLLVSETITARGDRRVEVKEASLIPIRKEILESRLA
ncbi:MAG: helix-turn-helix transcriptional regulator [Planctomycetes bacterium]|nr:helix-turn-helix transcriptional regulator [Planctomycetota bacterium]